MVWVFFNSFGVVHNSSCLIFSIFIEEASISEDKIVLPSPVKYEVGEYTTMVLPGGGADKESARFEPRDRGEGNTIRIPKRGFVVVYSEFGTGLLKAPAVLIKSKPYKDVLVLFFNSEGEVVGSGNLQVSRGEDFSSLSFKGVERRIEGSVYLALKEARESKVELIHEECHFEPIVVGKGDSFEFSRDLLPPEPIVLVTFDTAGLRYLADIFGEGEVIMGCGNYHIRLVLDLPRRRDVVDEAQFSVVCVGE